MPGIINADALYSAIGRPYTGHYRRIWSKAAALAESMVRNHPFTDGNKRTALIVVGVLLDRSGWTLGPKATANAVEELMLKIAAGELSFLEIEGWFRLHILSPAEFDTLYKDIFGENGEFLPGDDEVSS